MSMLSPLSRAAIGVALSLAAPSPAFSQTAATSTATPGAMIDGQANPFHLTAAQQTKITARKLKFQQDASQVMNDPTLSQAQKKATVDQMEANAAADVRADLTPAQRAQVDAQQAAANASVKAHASDIQALETAEETDATRYKATKTALISSLTNDQMSQIIQLEQTTKAQLEAIKANAALSDDEKSQQGAALVADHDAKQKALFNPQQIALVLKMEAISADGAAKEKQLNALLPPIVLPVK